ncbi:MAG TPA: enolase C-terminal domain-like protein [Candidatus Rubrimentiphilum sp.]|nr:enolase C-terminal domain-like protein [Candidatus Rubrimentiphilum sp.]
MTVTPIAFADPPLRSSYGLHAPYALRSIIELRSEDGIVGIAETHGGEQALAGFEGIRETVVGSDAYDLTGLSQRVGRKLAGLVPLSINGPVDRSQTYHVPGENRHDAELRIYAALEVAALDLIGKSIGRPMCDLLGGRVRDSIPFSAYLFYKHAGGGGEGSDARDDRFGECMAPGDIVEQARTLTKLHGFRTYKLKAGVLPPDIEIETILQLRDAFPRAPLRIDPNAAWSIPTALQVAGRLAGILEYLEDPVPGIPGMGSLQSEMRAANCSIPLASNVAITSFADIPAALQCDAAQIILGDHHYWGGPRAITQLGRICQTFGLGLSMHSNSHLGVSLLAMAHTAAATPQLTYACDTHYPWQSADDEIIVGGRVPIVDGAVRVPDAPGIGATLDYDQLARARERYEKTPYRRRNDADEMRKHVDPQWERIVPAW